MTTESFEELRERLLGQQNVQQMIRARAYEIYQMRGGRPGGEGQDWFHAQGEVLAFLLANESAREDQAGGESAAAAPAPEVPVKTPAARKPRPRAGAKRADAKAAAPKKTAEKQAVTRKSTESKSKSKRTSDQPKTEESGE